MADSDDDCQRPVEGAGAAGSETEPGALADLKLERIATVYPGSQRYAMAARVEAVPLSAMVNGMKGLFP